MIIKAVFVIIVNYNHLDDLKETISSFVLQNYPNLRIVISDNGSGDNSIAWLKENHSEITILENRKNLGWAEGNNVGIKYAIEQGADYILLANNDLNFNNPGIISKLIHQMQDHKDWIMGPVQHYFYQPEKLFSCGHYFMNITKPDFNTLRVKYLKENKVPGNLQVVDYVAGSFVMFPSELIKDIGWIDQDFYLYGEDADFFLRAWKKGYISMVDTDMIIFHKVSATSGDSSPLMRYYQSRNIWLNLKKHRDISSNGLFFIIRAMKGFLKSLFKDLIHFRGKLIRASLVGLWHGLIIKKFGKGYSF